MMSTNLSFDPILYYIKQLMYEYKMDLDIQLKDSTKFFRIGDRASEII